MSNQRLIRLNSFAICVVTLTTVSYFPILGCKMDSTAAQSDAFIDFDLDGVADHYDLDDDNDGITDEIETTADLDGDNIPNNLDRDSEGDGIPDLIEATGVDKDGDGIIDPWDEWEDNNHNGLHDEYEEEPLVEVEFSNGKMQWKSRHHFAEITLDQDNDGIPNFWDKDSDNDGVGDTKEVGNRYFKSEIVDKNGDGFDDRLVGHIYTQGDEVSRTGHPEFASLNERLYESVQYDGSFGILNGFPDIDDNNNGIPDFLDNSSSRIKH